MYLSNWVLDLKDVPKSGSKFVPFFCVKREEHWLDFDCCKCGFVSRCKIGRKEVEIAESNKV